MERASLGPLFYESGRQGTRFGILFTCMSACLLYSPRIGALSLLLVILGSLAMLYLPFALAKVARVNQAYSGFAALWMSGIVMYICGALICSLLTLIFLLFLEPGYLDGYVRNLIEQIMAQPNAPKPDLKDLVIPTPMEFVSSMFWATGFFGSLLSLVLALILPHTGFFRRIVVKLQ